MGPGRLTGMNVRSPDSGALRSVPASMGPGRLTGMNEPVHNVLTV